MLGAGYPAGRSYSRVEAVTDAAAAAAVVSRSRTIVV